MAVPGSHSVQDEAPAAEKVPGGQLQQWVESMPYRRYVPSGLHLNRAGMS